MSTYLSGGGRAAYRLDLDIIKSPSTSWTSNSSSPSSTLSESSNSSRIISTRKARTPRKRPNQIYNEAAAILSTAYPKLFPTKHKFTKSYVVQNPFFTEPSDLIMPFRAIDTSGFLLHTPIREQNSSVNEPKRFSSNPYEKSCQSPGEITSQVNLSEICDKCDEFDTESILDEEIEEGIDSIMGNLSMENESTDENSSGFKHTNNFCYGYPVGLGFDLGKGMRREARARNVDEIDWWRFPSVNVLDFNPKPKIAKSRLGNKKKKKLEITKLESAAVNSCTAAIKAKEIKLASEESPVEEAILSRNAGLLLKLNYDVVLDEWSDKESPFVGDAPGDESAGIDVQGRLAQIDLFPENEGEGEVSEVIRYNEKQHTRTVRKKIRHRHKSQHRSTTEKKGSIRPNTR